jgi:uncharacterized protein (TIGR03067 family)
MTLLRCFAVALLLVIASDAPVRSQKDAKETKEELIKKDLKALNGTWIAESGERRGGEKIPQTFLDTFSVVIDGDKLSVNMGKIEIKSTITIDPTKKPKEIDMLTENKVNSPAIYSLEKDTLKLVIDAEDKTRAKEFATEKDSTHMLFVLKRKKN